MRGDQRPERFHVFQDRLFPEEVPNDLRHKRIDPLVVGHTGPQRVGQADVARVISPDQPGDSQHAVMAERERVEEIVIDPAVDDVHPPEAPRRAPEDLPAVQQQVASLHQLDAHLPGEEAVLVVCRVIYAGAEDHDGRVVAGFRRDPAEHGQKVVRVVVDRPHVVPLEQEGEDLFHDLAVLEDVADSRGRPAVVLQNQEAAVGIPDQVDAGDVDIDVVRDPEPHALPAISRGPEDQLGGNHAVLEDPPLVVHVADEQVECSNPLLQPALDDRPLVGIDESWDRVEGDDPLDPLLAAVDRERDPLLAHRQVGHAMTTLEFFRTELQKAFAERAVVRSRAVALLEHLVVGRESVIIEKCGLVGQVCRMHREPGKWRVCWIVRQESIRRGGKTRRTSRGRGEGGVGYGLGGPDRARLRSDKPSIRLEPGNAAVLSIFVSRLSIPIQRQVDRDWEDDGLEPLEWGSANGTASDPENRGVRPVVEPAPSGDFQPRPAFFPDSLCPWRGETENGPARGDGAATCRVVEIRRLA